MMVVEQDKTNQIALNVTRTRVTVLVFNLTIIAFMFSIMKASGASADHFTTAHLTSSFALFVGFCLTLLGHLIYRFRRGYLPIASTVFMQRLLYTRG